jgi:hypothetical protein
MKKLITAIAILVSVSGFAQSGKYEAAMKKNLALFDSVKTTTDYLSLAAAFERIGETEKTQWLPYYYAALALSSPGWTDPNVNKDENAAKMKALCDKADALQKTSEVYEVRYMAALQQMLVDPQTRYMTAGTEMQDAMKKGLELNPENPRLYYLQGSNIFNTPEQWGGGKANAKPLLEKAVALYKKENETRKSLYPKWGEKEAEAMLAQCQ